MRTSTDGIDYKKELEFTCPKCEGHEIFEHLVNYEKVWVYENGEIENGDTEWWESDKVEYSCANPECFWAIVDEDNRIIKDQDSLIRSLLKLPKPNASSPETLLEFESPDSYSDDGDESDDEHVRFQCPECGGTQLAAVNETATYIVAYEDGSVEYLKTYGGDIEYFRCHTCRWILKDDEQQVIDDSDELVNWLTNNCDQNNREDD